MKLSPKLFIYTNLVCLTQSVPENQKEAVDDVRGSREVLPVEDGDFPLHCRYHVGVH